MRLCGNRNDCFTRVGRKPSEAIVQVGGGQERKKKGEGEQTHESCNITKAVRWTSLASELHSLLQEVFNESANSSLNNERENARSRVAEGKGTGVFVRRDYIVPIR